MEAGETPAVPGLRTSNLFFVNPTVADGGAWLSTNGGRNYYDSLVIELRRRMSKGLMVSGSYVFAKGLALSRLSYRSPYVKTTSNQLPLAL